MAEPRLDMNIKVAAFTVTQKLYNTSFLLYFYLFKRVVKTRWILIR